MDDIKETKLKLANILLIESVKAGKEITPGLVIDIFDALDQFEQEVINRKLIKSDKCPKCLKIIKFIDTHNSFETRCDCTASRGGTKEGAEINHLKQVLENA